MYNVQLDDNSIGETALELSDPPMGVVFGMTHLFDDDCLYQMIKDHCLRHNVTINQDEKKFCFIDTHNILQLKIFRSDGIEIAGVPGASICGFQDEGYQITILGVPYPFFEERRWLKIILPNKTQQNNL